MDTKLTITIKEDEKIIELLSRMLEIKKLENKEVECELNGKILTTENSSNIQEMLVNNSTIIFEYLEKDREILLGTPTMKKSIESFKNRGKKYDSSDVEPQKIAENIFNNTKKFDKKISELETLDFSDSHAVYNWLNSIIEFVNNRDLFLAPGLDKIEYKTSTNYIVKKLEDKGYTNQINPVNNLNDYYKRLISYQLDDLTKYGFFAYDYADVLRDKGIINEGEIQNSHNSQNNDQEANNQPAEENEMLLKLESERKELLNKLRVFESYKDGTILLKEVNKKKVGKEMPSYAERKEKIQKEITSLTLQIESDNKEVENEITSSKEQLEAILRRPGRLGTEEEHRVMQQYYTVMSSPSNNKEKILPTMEMVKALPQSSEIKPILLNILENTNTMTIGEVKPNLENEIASSKEQLETILRRPGRLGTEEEHRVMQQYYTLMSNPSNNKEKIRPTIEMVKALPQSSEIKKILIDILENTREKELSALKQKYENLVKEEQNVIKNVEHVKEKVKHQLDAITKEIERVKQAIKKQELSKELSANNNLPSSSSSNPMLSKGDLEEDYYQRLENADKEGSIFHDNDMDIDITPQDHKPHIIKSVKKASSKLINKIRNSKFIKKANQVLEKFPQLKVAIVEGAILVAMGIAGLTMSSNATAQGDNDIASEQIIVSNEDTVDNTTNLVPQETTMSENVVVEETTDEETFEENLQNTLNDILDGDVKVYRTSESAINNIDARTATESHLENSWANASENGFYKLENGVPQSMSEEEAESYWKDGGTVAVRWENDGQSIGWTAMEPSENSEKSM